MATSKGQGVAAHAIAEVLPPEQLRFLFLRPRPNQVIDFDPEGETIPRLFDEFDRICGRPPAGASQGRTAADHERLFAYSLLGHPGRWNAQANPVPARLCAPGLFCRIPGVEIESA